MAGKDFNIEPAMTMQADNKNINLDNYRKLARSYIDLVSVIYFVFLNCLFLVHSVVF